MRVYRVFQYDGDLPIANIEADDAREALATMAEFDHITVAEASIRYYVREVVCWAGVERD